MSTKMSTTEVYVDLSKCYFGAVLLTNMAMKGGYLWGRAIQVTFFF